MLFSLSPRSQDRVQRGPGGCCAHVQEPLTQETWLFHDRMPANLCSLRSGRSHYLYNIGLWTNLPSAPEGCRAVHYASILEKVVWNKRTVSALLVKTGMQKWEIHGEMPPNNRLSSQKLFVIQNMFSYRNNDLMVVSGPSYNYIDYSIAELECCTTRSSHSLWGEVWYTRQVKGRGKGINICGSSDIFQLLYILYF